MIEPSRLLRSLPEFAVRAELEKLRKWTISPSRLQQMGYSLENTAGGGSLSIVDCRDHTVPRRSSSKIDEIFQSTADFPLESHGYNFVWRPKCLCRLLFPFLEAEFEARQPREILLKALDIAMQLLDQQTGSPVQASHWVVRTNRWCTQDAICFFRPNQHPRNLSNSLWSSEFGLFEVLGEIEKGPNDLCGLAATLGLELYVKQAVRTSQIPMDSAYLEYVFRCAVYGLCRAQFYDIIDSKTPNLLMYMLDQASGINGSDPRYTPHWRAFLFCMHVANHRQKCSPLDRSTFLTEAWSAAAQIFLLRGFSPNERIEIQHLAISLSRTVGHNYITSLASSKGLLRHLNGTNIGPSVDIDFTISAFSVFSICLRDTTSFHDLLDICLQDNAVPYIEISSVQ